MSTEQKTQNFFNLLIALFTVMANVGIVIWYAADIRVTVDTLSQRIERISHRVDEINDDLSVQKIELGKIKGYIDRHEYELIKRNNKGK
jgi:hypothetical protein